ncbi:MAG: CBS domain-containing protein [Thermodesulfobacteriota bacterium]|nr:CBS domain-containing protein [Thermodesulfobacteriota bacterium]
MEVITTHINADFDALASMLAAKKLYTKAVIAFSGSQEKGLRDFFIQSTMYLFEIERLKNINFEDIDRLILVDTRQTSRIGKFSEILSRPGLEIHIYDHHPPSSEDISGSLEVIKEVGATTTILTQVLQDRKIDITPDEATVMALGIYEDTGSFTFTSTTGDDYIAAAYLLSKGANLNTVSDIITREFTVEDISLLNDLIESGTTHNINGIEIVIAKISTDKYFGDFAVLVHKMRDIKNINVLFVLARMEDRVHLVCRSRVDHVNVGEIAVEFGGGGHPTAASATIKDLTMIQLEEKLLNILHNKVGSQIYAKDIMAFPVKVIETTESLQKAGELLTRYNINVLPIVRDDQLCGLISRQIIEKAVFHGLKNLSVAEYMSSDFFTVSPDTPLIKIQDIMISNNQRFLPVVDKRKVVGTITRTQVLRAMQDDLLSKSSYSESSSNHTPSYVRKKPILKLIEEQLEKKILNILKALGQKAEELHYKAFLVGGIVRDIILRRQNLDIDVVVEGDGIDLARHFSKDFSCKVRYHKKFGTANLIFPDELKIDIATARLEYYDSPAALPNVELSSIKLDLYRRDFTMNTLAIRLNPSGFGELIDFYGAQKDIKEKIIRVIHNLSFVEDPTRIFRAIRFEQRFDFKIGKHTVKLIKNAVKMNFLVHLDGYRLFSELLLLFQEEKPVEIVKRLVHLNILKFIHPSIVFNDRMKSTMENIKEIIAWFDLLFLEEKYEKWLIYFFGLVDSLSNQEILEICLRLSMTEKDKKRLINGMRNTEDILRQFNNRKKMKKSDIYHILRSFPTEALLYTMAKTNKNHIKRALSLYFIQLKETYTILNGEDLKSLGITPGKIFKTILDDLLSAKLDGMVETRQHEIDFVKKKYIENLGS